ncbi:MAG: efflux transporter outer membrane subunit [Planctomycetes bacterium]|nr:efflux transporter outer membrane subunit [Planctomycetota bacterium]
MSLFLAVSCMVGPDYERPKPIPMEPFRPVEGAPSQAREAELEGWWKNYNDPVLTSLIERAEKGNLNLQQAAMNIAAYRSGYGISFSKLFPSISLDASYARVLSNRALNQGALTPDTPFNYWSEGAMMTSWEIDLFGKIRRGMEASKARLEGSVQAWRSALVAVRSDVASAYLAVRTYQAELGLAKMNVDLLEQVFKVVTSKYKAKVVSQIDLSQAAAQLAVSRAMVPKLEASIQQQCNGLSVLLGESPGPMQDELRQTAAIPLPEGMVDIGIPADLIRRRADILSAEMDLAAATAEIGVAEAGYYPELTIQGDFSIAATDFAGLGNWSNQVYAFGPKISWNFFNGGLVTSQVSQRQAIAFRLAIRWKETVLKAASEVQSALGNYGGALRQMRDFQSGLSDVETGFKLVFARYKSGTIDLTNLLSYQQIVLQAESGYMQARGLAAQNLVDLYRTLGGGWETAEIPVPGRDAFEKNGPDMLKPMPSLKDEAEGNT